MHDGADDRRRDRGRGGDTNSRRHGLLPVIRTVDIDFDVTVVVDITAVEVDMTAVDVDSSGTVAITTVPSRTVNAPRVVWRPNASLIVKWTRERAGSMR